MDQIIEFIRNTNWQMIIAMFAIGWYFTRDITAKVALEKRKTEKC